MIHRRCAISRAQLIDAMATGRPIGAIARDLGRYDRQSLAKLMQCLGIERTTSIDGVVTIVARSAAVR